MITSEKIYEEILLSAYSKGIASEVKLRMLSYNNLDPLEALIRAFNEELKLM
jgi:hypothetical protein